MKKFIFAAFEDRDESDGAINALSDAGYTTNDISIVTRHEYGEKAQKETSSAGQRAASGAGSGAVTGGIIGGLAGFLAGVAGIIIVGPIAALLGLGGIIATTVSGLVIGAAAGGLVGALVRIGLPKETAERYEAIVRGGGLVLAVPVEDIRETEIRAILADHGADDIAMLEVPEK